MKRYPGCRIVQDNGLWSTDYGQVTINGESPAARVAVYAFDEDRGAMRQTDRLEDATVTEHDNGEVTITGRSVYVLQNQGVAVQVKMHVIPGRQGCAGCG
jgi:hypothetical protein